MIPTYLLSRAAGEWFLEAVETAPAFAALWGSSKVPLGLDPGLPLALVTRKVSTGFGPCRVKVVE